MACITATRDRAEQSRQRLRLRKTRGSETALNTASWGKLMARVGKQFRILPCVMHTVAAEEPRKETMRRAHPFK